MGGAQHGALTIQQKKGAPRRGALSIPNAA
jgi:hypothetical protein